MKKILLPITIVLCLLPSAHAQKQKEKRDYTAAIKKIVGRFEPAEAKPGETVTLKVDVELNSDWHTYPTKQDDPAAKLQVNQIKLPPPGDVVFVEPVHDPVNFKEKAIPDLGIERQHYYIDSATWEFKAVVSPKATSGKKTISLQLFKILVCWQVGEDEGCLPPKDYVVSAPLTIDNAPAVAVDPKYKEIVDKSLGGSSAPSVLKTAESKKDVTEPSIEPKETGLLIPKDADYAQDMAAVQKMLPAVETNNAGFVAFVLTAMFWGAVTLLTPCVFPMVPITVSYFLKQGEKKLHNPLAMATVYTLTIVAVLGFAARFALGFFRWLAVDPWMNAALGILFVVFAMSLFGMFDIVLPSFLVRFTSSRECKGGYGGVIFMALSFSIVSFTCVAPFLGGFAGMAASGKFSELQLLAGGFAFAGTFAAPFFLLAMFPTLLKKLPRSGGWMNTIKVVMGFLELAAALKFFRNAELRWTEVPSLFTYDLVLSVYVVILFLAGFYLLNLYRLPHDEPQEHIGVPRMLTGLLSISIGLYLLPGLFAGANHEKQRPGGTVYAWVDAFLLPEPTSSSGGGEGWSGNLRGSIEIARERGEVIFVDFTGKTCTNCKLNEKNVFPKPNVNEVLKKFRTVQMYTDEVPSVFYEGTPDLARQEQDAQTNLKFQRDVFKDEKLPLYVLLRPQAGPRGSPVDIVGVYDEGKINDVDGFVNFLKKGVK